MPTSTFSIPQYKVSGKITDIFNVPVSGVKVQVFDKTLRSEQLLGATPDTEVHTDSNGSYQISFLYLSIPGREYKTPDVFVRVKDSQGLLLGQSAITFNVGVETTIDLQINTKDEFTQLLQITRLIATGAGVAAIKDLQENEENKDISFLTAETGIGADKIKMLIRAHQLADDVSKKLQAINSNPFAFNTANTNIPALVAIPPAFFYALLRQGQSDQLGTLLKTANNQLHEAVKKAVIENIVPEILSINLATILQAFHRLLAHDIIEGADISNEKFKRMIALALPSSDLQKKFVEAYAATSEEPERFWAKLTEQHEFADGKLIETTKQILKLNMLTGNQPELAGTLYEKQQTNISLKEMSGFAQFTKEDWKGFITESNITKFPEGITGETNDEKAEQYAASLESLMQILYPVDVFVKRLEKDMSPHWSSLKSQLIKFLDNNKSFNLKTANIKKELAGANFTGINNKTGVEEEMKKINRLYKLSGRQEHVSTMRNAGIGSAVELVTKFSPIQFAKQFAPAFGSVEAVNEYYNKAKSTNNKVTLVAYELMTNFDAGNPAVMKMAQPQNETNDVFKLLFNPGGLCECEHCMSIYSPAAYFADTLKYLRDKAPHSDGDNTSISFKKIMERRPDLQYINLTCENTNTPVPYIDLVNEILENEIWKKQEGLPDDEKINALQLLQTGGGANEITAMPEHINDYAYRQLKTISGNAVLNPSLPLDLPLEELRLYLGRLGYKRYELMELFYGKREPGKYNDAAIAAEHLEFTPGEITLLNGNSSFGINVPDTIVKLLQTLGISYIGLLQLLETNFLNPINESNRALSIVAISADPSKAATCNLDELKINGADIYWMDKAIRFIRLWRKTRWDVFDLDRFFTAFGITGFSDFENEILLPLSHVARIQQLLNLPVRKILSFFNDIDTTAYQDHTKDGQPVMPSMYMELFRNKAMIKLYGIEAEQGFFPANFETIEDKDFAAYVSSDNNQSALLSTALGIALPEFEFLVNGVGNNKFIDVISSIYRIELLAGTINIPVTELIEFINFAYNGNGLTPLLEYLNRNIFDSTEKLLLFLDNWTFLKSTHYKVADLKDQLSGKIGDDHILSASREVLNTLDSIMADLDSIKTRRDELINIPGEEERKQKEQILNEEYNLKLNDLFDLFMTENAQAAFSKKIFENEETDIQAIKDELQLGDKDKFFKLDEDKIRTGINKSKELLYKVITAGNMPLLFKSLGFELAEMEFINKAGYIFQIDALLDFTLSNGNANFKAFKKLYLLILLKKQLQGSKGVTELFGTVIHSSENGSFEIDSNGKTAFFEKFSQLTFQPIQYLDFLSGLVDENGDQAFFNNEIDKDYFDAQVLVNSIACCKTIEALSKNPNDVVAAIKREIIADDANSIFKVLRAKYDEQQWLNIIKPVSDQLRIRRRDALVAFLLAAEDNNWYTTNDIYGHLLIDTEMDACMMTSRIKQAISSVQLFIDRCLMGLEEGSLLNGNFAGQWETWRARYRVWEANRKIFLYPENWIEPELRDDKSPFFKELESKLLQNEVTQETAEDAIIEYLHKLDEVAKLEITGIYQENFTVDDDDDEDKVSVKNIVHVFGRTADIPHKYFYRKQINKSDSVNPLQENGIWTPWERVELDIEGDHIIPVIWNKRPMLYWAIFTEKQDNSDEKQVPHSGDSMPGGKKYWEVKFAFSEYKRDKWIPKKITKEKRLNWYYDNRDIQKEDIVIRLIPGETIQFKIYHANDNYLSEGEYFFEQQNFATPQNGTTAKRVSGQAIPPHIPDNDTPVVDIFVTGQWVFCSPPGTMFNSMRIVEDGYDSLSLTKKSLIENRNFRNKLLPTEQDSIFLRTPGHFTITPPATETYGISLEPFAYSDANGQFIVKTWRELIMNSWDEGSFKRHYKFQSLFYSFSDQFVQILNTKGIDGLYKKDIRNQSDEVIFTDISYGPQSFVDQSYPVKTYDFSTDGSCSIYNWELFFHIPLLIATGLSKNQKFEEARKWFHYVFNPTMPSNEGGIERFWITKPFFELAKNIDNILSIEEILDADNNPGLQKQIDYWEDNPFKPHAVARMRVAAYMRTVVMKYIDNLIAWGDHLFRQDTLETINEATLLYVLSQNILGKRQDKVPPRAIPKVYSFSSLPLLDPFIDAKAEIESFILPSASNNGQPDVLSDFGAESTINETGNPVMPLFCIPKNERMLSYWNTVEDRLFKIRHCENIEGVFRQLPLFEPPLDPGLLVRASAAGLDIASIINEGYLSLPSYRFNIMVAKANELCNDVRTLGNLLLSAFEKRDAEQLSLIRSGQELGILQAMRDIKQRQRDEAEQNLESLNKSKETVEFRKDYYLSRKYRTASEKEYFYLTQTGNAIETALNVNSALASLQYLIPQYNIGPWIMGTSGGGMSLGNATMSALKGGHALASSFKTAGELANINATYERRADDWKFQGQSADLELKQIDRQILAAEIRLVLAERDLEIHEQQIENAKNVDDFMRDKFTNQELYNWMVGQVSSLYFQSYQMAFDTAKKAEKCFQYELGIEGTNYIQYGYWDSLKKGLLSGEKLQYDLRRLENAYLEQNKREFEITKHISLSLINPYELLKLKETGTCDIIMPEELFDLDFPGHYFRRIKSVSISIPCIAGPYTSVNASLRLTKNEYRLKVDSNEYKKTGDEDSRFRTVINPISVIATSNAQNDSGVFELNFRDERYLPFEGTGATSTWKLELIEEKALRQFDYNSISDIILHLKYTAREDSQLKQAAITNLKTILTGAAEGKIFQRLLSIKNDFPDDFYKFLNSDPQVIEFDITSDFFPYFLIDKHLSIDGQVKIYLKPKRNMAVTFPNTGVMKINGVNAELKIEEDIPKGGSENEKIKAGIVSLTGSPLQKWKIDAGINGIDKDKTEDILILIKYKID